MDKTGKENKTLGELLVQRLMELMVNELITKYQIYDTVV